MRVLLFSVCIVLALLSCKKNKPEEKVNYDLPWSTEFIHYENGGFCGNHSGGYKIFYKDSLILEYCESFNGYGVGSPLRVNNSILYLRKGNVNVSYVLYTKDGGLNWQSEVIGPSTLKKFHNVSPELMYSVTQISNRLFFTGVGQSSLKLHEDTLAGGTHYISDPGTTITDLDSTVIEINDSARYVILFN